MNALAVVAAALALAGAQPYHVVCVPMEDTWGVTYYDSETIALHPDACAQLRIVSRKGEAVAGWFKGQALLDLIHEARHASGVLNECDTEAWAFANVRYLVYRFVPAKQRSWAMRGAQDYHRWMPPSYHQGCST